MGMRDSVFALLRKTPVKADPVVVENIRATMMRLHGEKGREKNPRLHIRLRQAQDPELLWYMRAELYADLCRLYDETHAVHSVQSLVPLFRDALPKSLLKNRLPTGAEPPPLMRKRRKTLF